MFKAVVFKTDKRWKNQNAHQQINKIWYIHKGEYYLIMERNEVLVHDTTWMNHENIMLSERSQTKKVTYRMAPFI
jgi:hypothetical protein